MKDITIEVCVCTCCVMNGAMNIIESIEGLARVQKQHGNECNIKIETNKMIGGQKHNDACPIVMINGELLSHTNTESVMAKILELASK